ncbi:trypsin-like peptidase domain-containing protein [Viridibacterium curvum]|uniref:Do family serine endopeptidase n=1 Tax=Viridibacterium curvum TaxID=1101404 RepID=A0ABP9QC72_9RHOO
MRRLWLIFAQTVTIALALLLVVSVLRPDWLPRGDAPAPAVQVLSAPPSTASAALPATGYAQAAQAALPAVVPIFTSKAIKQQRHPFLDDPLFRHFFGERPDSGTRRASGLGSGVIVSPDGYILTNNHVVEAADEIEISLPDNSRRMARIIGRDPDSDLAVLRVDVDRPLPAITFARSEALHVGDVVLAIGNPFGVGQTVTMGIVSALNRSHLGINTFENFIQTDAAINPGNSGGALVDIRGQLVGINTAIYSRSGGSLGIGFAIPSDSANKIMQEIIRTGGVTRGWIGVEVQEITPDLSEAFKVPRQGALIAGVARNSPADTAGVLPGDALVSIEGEAIRDVQAMLERIAALQPGKSARVGFIRKGQAIELKMTVAKRPGPDNQRAE